MNRKDRQLIALGAGFCAVLLVMILFVKFGNPQYYLVNALVLVLLFGVLFATGYAAWQTRRQRIVPELLPKPPRTSATLEYTVGDRKVTYTHEGSELQCDAFLGRYDAAPARQTDAP